MNYLELQQRANILVNKVNEYESNLTGQTINESEILDQHLYADIYSLRPVMKMLFGKDLTEKLNRTLENDVDLKVYALNSPLNRTSFSLLSSYNPYPLDEYNTYSIQGSPNISNGLYSPTEGYNYVYYNWQSYFNVNENEYTTLHIRFRPNDSQFYNTTYSFLSFYSNSAQRIGSSCSISVGITSSINIFGDKQYIENYNSGPNAPWIDVSIKFTPSSQTGYGAYSNIDYSIDCDELNFHYSNSQDNVTLISQDGEYLDRLIFGRYNNTFYCKYLQYDLNNTYLTLYKQSFEEGYTQEVVHDNVISLDTYNSHNMLIQDAYVNTVVDRNTRIKAGINYSYSSNIQDALVTESQVANLFKWNTTTSLDISNNSMSINRQVPGIVVYYLGTDYDSTYTATIPYNPGSIKLNQINYSTPPYYGAYYMTDETQSQIGLQMGAEACRIFMPGLNYTRGQLESPQQIWQPDRLVGTANVGLGYNWQGGSVYHELVFKNRRSGAKDIGVDFIPSVESDIDNDPQGLALRTALAQQKPYYYNRLWFSELDELYGANISNLAEDIINAQKTEIIPAGLNTDMLEIVGAPTISDTGVASNFSDSDYIQFINPEEYSLINENIIWILDFTTGEVASSNAQKFFAGDQYCRLYILSSYCTIFINGSGAVQLFAVTANTHYRLRVTFKSNRYKIESYNFETETWSQVANPSKGSDSGNASTLRIGTGELQFTNQPFDGSINLPNCSVQLDSESDPIPFYKIEEEIIHYDYADDEDFYTSFRLDYDTWAEAFDKPL